MLFIKNADKFQAKCIVKGKIKAGSFLYFAIEYDDVIINPAKNADKK